MKLTKKEAFKMLDRKKIYAGEYTKEVQMKLFEIGFEWCFSKKNIREYKFMHFIFGKIENLICLDFYTDYDSEEITVSQILEIELESETKKSTTIITPALKDDYVYVQIDKNSIGFDKFYEYYKKNNMNNKGIIKEFEIGDFITNKYDARSVSIYGDTDSRGNVIFLVSYSCNELNNYITSNQTTNSSSYRLSTQAEKEFLLRKLCVLGKGWDENKKHVFKLEEKHIDYVSEISYKTAKLFAAYCNLLPSGKDYFDDDKKQNIYDDICDDLTKINELYGRFSKNENFIKKTQINNLIDNTVKKLKEDIKEILNK